MRTTALILTLLLLAAAVVTTLTIVHYNAGPLRLAGPFPMLWGLAIAQVQLAVAATVLMRRWLVVRVIIFAMCVAFWSLELTRWKLGDDRLLNIGVMLLGIALVTAAWCGASRFWGWRVGHLQLPLPQEELNRQFSLATVMLAMTLVGVYAGLLKLTQYPANNRNFVFLACLLLSSLPSCALLTAMVKARWHWTPLAIVTVLLLVAYPAAQYNIAAYYLRPIVLTAVAFVGCVVLVLRFANIRLMRCDARIMA